MTKEERISRYEAIVKWGKEYITSMDDWVRKEHQDFYAFDRELLSEYEKGLCDLKAQEDA